LNFEGSSINCGRQVGEVFEGVQLEVLNNITKLICGQFKPGDNQPDMLIGCGFVFEQKRIPMNSAVMVQIGHFFVHRIFNSIHMQGPSIFLEVQAGTVKLRRDCCWLNGKKVIGAEQNHKQLKDSSQ
jgi:hypothetical protein